MPKFTPQVVIDQLRDGYWLESPAINQDGKPDLIGYGPAMSEIYWYENGPGPLDKLSGGSTQDERTGWQQAALLRAVTTRMFASALSSYSTKASLLSWMSNRGAGR